MNNQLENLIMMYFQINTGHIVSIKGTDNTDMRGGSQQESMLVTNSAMVVYFGNYIDSVNEMSSCKRITNLLTNNKRHKLFS